MPCYKIAYPTRPDARRVARTAPGHLHEYHCRWCDAWHLSSKTARQIKLLKRHGTTRATT